MLLYVVLIKEEVTQEMATFPKGFKTYLEAYQYMENITNVDNYKIERVYIESED